MSATLVGRYRPDGSVHVVAMREVSEGLVRLTTWCGGDLPIRHDIEAVCADKAAERVTCRNCTSALQQYELPLGVLV
jgi:hypothetical protein